jgi:membrane-bound ClpP family serine protease
MNVDRVMGAEGLLIEAIDPASNTGRVRLPFEQWKVASADGQSIALRTRVKVVRRDSTTLLVRPVDSKNPSIIPDS